MAKTWIKLYTEILSDPKMGRMNDKMFRRTIELFLIAGKEDRDGMLPSLDDIAWSLHSTVKEIQTVLSDLKSIGIIEEKSEGYLIKHFSERQNSDSSRSEINRRYYENSKLRKSEIQTSEILNKTSESDNRQSENKTAKKSEIQTIEEEVEEEVDKEEEVNILTADAVEVLPAPKPIDWKRAFGPEAGRAQAFSEVTGITPIKSEFGRWQKDLKAFTEAGISIDQMKAACAYMKREKLTIGAPGSLFKIARSLKNAAPTDPQTVSDFPDFYSAIQALTDHPEIIDL